MSDVVQDFREASRYLITSVALITSTGPHGPNVMSAEWTFQVSYRPMRLMVLVNPAEATCDNIVSIREFGANFLGDDQAALASLAGYYTGREVNKLSSELFQTYGAKKISAPMILGCFLNAECKVVEVFNAGDHTMFLGDVVEVQFDRERSPLLYSQRRYWHRGSPVEKGPGIYLTCTARPDLIRVDGRLKGAENYPQKVVVAVATPGKFSDLKETVETDQHGYFQLVLPQGNLQKGNYTARAEWNGLTGRAIARTSKTFPRVA